MGRERVALLRALNLGDGQGAEARREKAQWMEVFAEVSRHHGAEAFLAYLQSLQKHVGLCRYCQTSSSQLGLMSVAPVAGETSVSYSKAFGRAPGPGASFKSQCETIDAVVLP